MSGQDPKYTAFYKSKGIHLDPTTKTPFTLTELQKIKEYFIKHPTTKKLPRTLETDGSIRGFYEKNQDQPHKTKYQKYRKLLQT